MTYFEGFIAPVPEANKDAYKKHATNFSSLSPEFGIGRHVEAWDSDVPEGKNTDFRKAVDAKPDEKAPEQPPKVEEPKPIDNQAAPAPPPAPPPPPPPSPPPSDPGTRSETPLLNGLGSKGGDGSSGGANTGTPLGLSKATGAFGKEIAAIAAFCADLKYSRAGEGQ